MRYIYLLIFPMLLSASILDFKYLQEAKDAYSDKNYTKAQESYAKVDSDEARFNQADALYRQKKYKEAIDIYNSIKESKLEAKKLHNIGNAYAQMNKLDEAIKSYENALKLKEDNDTRFNLELLKKRKKEKKKKQKQKQNKKSNKDNKDNKNQKNQKDNNKKSSKDKKESDKKKSKQEKEKEKEKKNLDKKKKDSKEKRKNQENNQTKQIKEQNSTKTPISNMEERKWQKMLNQRGVNTLMIPLNKGKKDNEDKPW